MILVLLRSGRTSAPRPPEPTISSRRKTDKAVRPRPTFVARPFAGRVDETEWVALREIVPSATAPLTLRAPAGREVLLTTVLPTASPGMVRRDGIGLLALQVQTRSGDASRDLAAVLQQVLVAEPGDCVGAAGLPEAGPRLQDLLDDAPLRVTVHDGFEHWVQGSPDDGELAATRERADATVVPTARLGSVASAYWCRLRHRAHLRWVLPEDEEPLLDALARLSVTGGLSLGDGTRYVGSFRAHGLLVPVWDLPVDMTAEQLEEPAAGVRARLDEALAAAGPLSDDQRRARQGLLSRQLTLR